jgi:branched-chain amino acid aminotransferase
LPESAPRDVILAIEPLAELPSSYYENGVTAACFSVHRKNPLAKTNDWVHLRELARESLQKEVYEVIALSPEEKLLEGFSSNFYALLNGVLHMEPNRALRGIARMIVLEVSEGLVPFELNAVCLADVKDLEEAFMTSSGRGVLPVVQIDDTIINKGQPGPVTREIQSRYNTWVNDHLEPI